MQTAANLNLKSWMQYLKLEPFYTFFTPACQPVSQQQTLKAGDKITDMLKAFLQSVYFLSVQIPVTELNTLRSQFATQLSVITDL